MEDKNKMEEELIYGTDDIALSLFEAWQYCYSEYFTLEEYFERVAAYLREHFDTIIEEIKNADEEE